MNIRGSTVVDVLVGLLAVALFGFVVERIDWKRVSDWLIPALGMVIFVGLMVVAGSLMGLVVYAIGHETLALLGLR